jgi:excisionase family DNA binding protein
MSDRLLVDKAEAARRLNVSLRTISNLLFSGSLQSCAIGRRRLVAVVDLEAYVDRLRSENQPQLTVVAPRRLRSG